ncbi:MAG: hypothetical protein QM722_22095 [Piscinibacter sp.]
MKSFNSTARRVSTLVLAAASAAATAQSTTAAAWVDNDSFGFESCAALAAVPASEDAQGTLASLRASAEADLRLAAQLAGVSPADGQHLSLTPVAGRFACGAQPSEVTFRVAVLDRSGSYRSTDLVVASDESATSQTAIIALANQLSRTLRGAVAQATIR